jgi:hypothetical protein
MLIPEPEFCQYVEFHCLRSPATTPTVNLDIKFGFIVVANLSFDSVVPDFLTGTQLSKFVFP